MTLKEQFQWVGGIQNRLQALEQAMADLTSSPDPKFSYSCFIGTTSAYSLECFVEGELEKSEESARLVVSTALEYFYGSWRKTQSTPNGHKGHESWKPFCLWYDQIVNSLPWAAALEDWNAVRRIADYPPEDQFPEATKASGETAWVWALITFLRGAPRKQVEGFLVRAEVDKSKRPKLLCPVMRGLLENDAKCYEKALLTYLAYYRKKEFRVNLEKIVSFDGTTLYHLGRKQGFNIQLPDDVADHLIRYQ